MNTRFIFVTGGVMSSLGKGIFASSLGNILARHGLRVSIQKLDPYLNIDAGTMSPFQHGEVFVTDDGAETDLDIGHYERFLDQRLHRGNNVTTGQIYDRVLSRERQGAFLGGTVQVIPHITDALKEAMTGLARQAPLDVLIVEVGGTVGDIESLPFLEAIRQLQNDLGRERTMFCHLTLLPYIEHAGEVKTKPTQHSVKELRSIGIQPDMIVCRTTGAVSDKVRQKISLFCTVPAEMVIENRNQRFLYEIPFALEQEGVHEKVARRLGLDLQEPRSERLQELVAALDAPSRGTVRIGLVGKYVALKDAYISVHEALTHAGLANDVRVEVDYVDAEEVDEGVGLSAWNGILIPGGFGERGIEGKLGFIRAAREQKVPLFGICLGMQCMVIEYARSVCSLDKANSSEFDAEGAEPIIDWLPEQRDQEAKGGTMRLGLYPCRLRKGSLSREIYGEELVYERHRHRYEVNPIYRAPLEENGMLLSGMSPDGRFAEIVELPGHPWFLGCQFHPEFLSRPHRAHPLFRDFIRAAVNRRDERGEERTVDHGD